MTVFVMLIGDCALVSTSAHFALFIGSIVAQCDGPVAPVYDQPVAAPDAILPAPTRTSAAAAATMPILVVFVKFMFPLFAVIKNFGF